MIGRKGSEDCPKECPAHLTIPERGGSTSVASMSYLTFD